MSVARNLIRIKAYLQDFSNVFATFKTVAEAEILILNFSVKN